MDIAFETIGPNECVLCGASESLTGEHKIKASLIRHEFRDRPMIMHGVTGMKLIQSPKSKTLHFNSKLCSRCNSERTQPADRAFDQLHDCLCTLLRDGKPLVDEAGRPMCCRDPKVELGYFRYFAKMLCLFVAEVGGPRPKELASFAIGRSNRARINLRIAQDADYEGELKRLDSQGRAKHGGLRFELGRLTGNVQSIISSLSAGGVRYEFRVQLRWLESLELRANYPALLKLARERIEGR